jgi:hypothetical protein
MKKIDPLDAKETDDNLMDGVDNLLSPEERLWVRLIVATDGAYRDWTPRWEWNLYKSKCPNFGALKGVINGYLLHYRIMNRLFDELQGQGKVGKRLES